MAYKPNYCLQFFYYFILYEATLKKSSERKGRWKQNIWKGDSTVQVAIIIIVHTNLQ